MTTEAVPTPSAKSPTTELKEAVERLGMLAKACRMPIFKHLSIVDQASAPQFAADLTLLLAALSQLKSAPVGSGAGVPLNQHGQVAGLFKDASSPALSQPEGLPAMGVEEVAKQGAWLILRNRIGPAYADRSQAAQSPEWHNAVRDARAILTISPQAVPARGEEGVG